MSSRLAIGVLFVQIEGQLDLQSHRIAQEDLMYRSPEQRKLVEGDAVVAQEGTRAFQAVRAKRNVVERAGGPVLSLVERPIQVHDRLADAVKPEPGPRHRRTLAGGELKVSRVEAHQLGQVFRHTAD